MNKQVRTIVTAAQAIATAARIAGDESLADDASRVAAHWENGGGWITDAERLAIDACRTGSAYQARKGQALLSALDLWSIVHDNLVDAPAGWERARGSQRCGHRHRTRLAASRCSGELVWWLGEELATGDYVIAIWPGLRPWVAELP